MRLMTACRRLTRSLLTHTVHCSLRPIDTSSFVKSMRRPISAPEIMTKHGWPAPLGRSDGSEIAVRRPGRIEAMILTGRIDSTRGYHGVNCADCGDPGHPRESRGVARVARTKPHESGPGWLRYGPERGKRSGPWQSLAFPAYTPRWSPRFRPTVPRSISSHSRNTWRRSWLVALRVSCPAAPPVKCLH